MADDEPMNAEPEGVKVEDNYEEDAAPPEAEEDQDDAPAEKEDAKDEVDEEPKEDVKEDADADADEDEADGEEKPKEEEADPKEEDGEEGEEAKEGDEGNAEADEDADVVAPLPGTEGEAEAEEEAPAEPKKPTIPFRIALMQLSSTDAEIVVTNMLELAKLNLHEALKDNKKISEKDKVLVSKGGAAMSVMQSLQNHGLENTEIANKGLSLLLSLQATNEKGCLDAIIELNGCELVLKIMKKHSEDVNVQIHGLGLLCNFSEEKNQVPTISKFGGVDLIIKDMLTWPKLPYMQRRGCKTLANMADKKKKLPAIREEIRKKKGLSTVGRCLESFPNDSDTFVEARRAMQCFI